jgi:hypothetical protein
MDDEVYIEIPRKVMPPHELQDLGVDPKATGFWRLADMIARRDKDFFSRVKLLIEFIEAQPGNTSRAVELAQQHLRNGTAGKALCGQLRQFKAGHLNMDGLKSRWRVCFPEPPVRRRALTEWRGL